MNPMTSIAQYAQIWSRNANVATIAYIILTGLVFAATAFVSYASYRSQQFNNSLQSAKDNEIKLVQADAVNKQSVAAQEIATLKAQAATLNVQAAALNAEAEKSKKGVADANARIAEAENAIAEANKQAQVALSTAAEAHVRQEEIARENYKLKIQLEEAVAESRAKQKELELAQSASQRKIELVRKNQSPRVLTSSQTSELVNTLSTEAGSQIVINSTFGDAESLSYANQIKTALQAAGWQVDGVSQAVFVEKQVGLRLFYSGQYAPSYAMSLLNAFEHTGLQIKAFSGNSATNDEVVLNVGLKPSTASK